MKFPLKLFFPSLFLFSLTVALPAAHAGDYNVAAAFKYNPKKIAKFIKKKRAALIGRYSGTLGLVEALGFGGQPSAACREFAPASYLRNLKINDVRLSSNGLAFFDHEDPDFAKYNFTRIYKQGILQADGSIQLYIEDNSTSGERNFDVISWQSVLASIKSKKAFIQELLPLHYSFGIIDCYGLYRGNLKRKK